MSEIYEAVSPALSEIYEAVSPALPIAVDGLFTLFIGWLMMRLPPALRTYVERNHREALQAALVTGARNALDRNPETSPGAAVEMILAHVAKSVPDALAALRPRETVLRNLAESKLRELRG